MGGIRKLETDRGIGEESARKRDGMERLVRTVEIETCINAEEAEK